MAELVPVSKLPAVPASRALSTHQDDSSVLRRAKLIRVVLRDYSLNARWLRMVDMAMRDPNLRNYVPEIVFPVGCAPLLGKTDYRLGSLGNDGRWVYARLHYLVTNVLVVLASTDASHVLGVVRMVLEKYRDVLLWNAAADIILAQQIVDAENYQGARSLMSPAFKPIAINGVAELRNRVLYIIDALDLMYRLALQCEQFQRDQEQVFVTDELNDAIEWFRSFAAVAESMREPEASQGPSLMR